MGLGVTQPRHLKFAAGAEISTRNIHPVGADEVRTPGSSFTVLHVSQPTEAGVARYVEELVGDQIARGWRVVVACPSGRLAERVKELGGVPAVWEARRRPGVSTLAETARLGRIIQSVRPDVVHLHSAKAGLAGRLALRGRRPTVVQPHGWSFFAAEGAIRAASVSWERLAARWAHAIVCVSDAERRIGESKRVRGRWHVVPNAVDSTRFPAASAEDKLAARGRLGLPRRAPVIVCVGRLSRAKGQDILLDAWPAVLARVPDAKLVLVGDGPDEVMLKRRATEGVTFAGHQDDVWSWLAAADAVALPSRWEGMSIAMLEAMSVGRATVATDVPGARDALKNGGGAIVPVGSPTRLAAALVERLLDPGRADLEGVVARSTIQADHNLRSNADRISAIYRAVTNGRR